jgi:hypothetical protein
VSRSREFDQIEAVSERVAYIGHAPVFAAVYFTVKRGSEATESSNHLVEIGHDEIKV